MKKNYPQVSIITVNFNGKKYLEAFFNSVFKLNYPQDKLKVILVDNVSTDDSVELVRKKYPRVKIIRNRANNYCQAVNLGIKASPTELVALANNDTRMDRNWLIELVKVIAEDKKIACVGSKILTMDGKIQNAGHYELPNFYWGERGAGRNKEEFDSVEEVTSLCGAAVLYRKSALLEAGLFDEDFIIYGEDVDIALRLRQKNYKLLFVPRSLIYHKFHGTADNEFSRYYIERNRLLYLAKHYPHKLNESLLGNGNFTIKKSVESLGNLYLVLPEIILKLIKTHPQETANKVIHEMFGEIKRISNLENDVLAAELKKQTQDLQVKIKQIMEKDQSLTDKSFQIKAFQEEIKTLEEREKTILAQQEEQSKDKTAQIKMLQEQIRALVKKERAFKNKNIQVNALQDEIKVLRSREKSLIADKQNKKLREKETLVYKEQIKNLSEKLISRVQEVFSRDQQLIDRKTEIDFLKKELSGLAEQLADNLVTIEENKALLQNRENDITAYKEELVNIFKQLRQRLDEVLIKDGQLAEAAEGKVFLETKLVELSKQLCQRAEEITAKDTLIADKENKISALNVEITAKNDQLTEKEGRALLLDSELLNLSNQLRQRIDQVLIKDGELIEAQVQIASLHTEVSAKDSLIADKENKISSLHTEVSAKDSQLAEKENKISALNNELGGIYNSEGFRFILRPLWTAVWNIRQMVLAAFRKSIQGFWLGIAALLTPVYLGLGLCFLMENIAGFIFRPLLRAIAPKRKVKPIKDSKISLVIPNYNGVAFLKECLPSVFSADGFSEGQNEVLIVDDCS